MPLIDPFIVSVQALATPTYSSGYEVIPNPTAITSSFSVFLEDKYSSLNSWIGYERCTASLPPSPVVPLLANGDVQDTRATGPSPVSGAALPSATTTESPVSVRHISTTQIIIVSTIVPIFGLVLLVLCFILLRRYPKKRNQAVVLNQPNMTSNTQLYVDRKAELENEERRRHEMDTEIPRYEVEGEGRVLEMPCDRDPGTVLPSLREIHEMRGAEHSQELEISGNVS